MKSAQLTPDKNFLNTNGKYSQVISCSKEESSSKSPRDTAVSELHLSEELYRTATEHSLMGVLMVQDGKIIYANPMLCEIGDYRLDDLLGKDPLDFVHPDDREMVARCIQKRIEKKEKYSRYRYQGLKKNGETLWLEVAATSVEYNGKNASLSTIIDITDRIISESLIRQKMETERAVAGISSLFIAPENLSNAISESLERISSIYGCSRCYVFMMRENNTVMDNTHEWSARNTQPQKEKLQNLLTDDYPWLLQKLHRGETIHVADISSMPPGALSGRELLEMLDVSSLIVVPLYISKQVAGFIAMGNMADTGAWSRSDIAVLETFANLVGSVIERIQKEETLDINTAELKSAYEELEGAYEELRSLDRMKNQFLANLSHELKTPLNSICGYSSLLDQELLGKLNEKQKKSVDVIVSNSGKLNTLIDSLLYVGNVLAGNARYTFDCILIGDVIDRLIENYSDIAGKKRIIFSKSLDVKHHFIEADIDYLTKLMDNLMDNAVKFTPEDGQIHLSVHEEHSNMHIILQDSGIGIPEESIGNVFDSFYQVDGSSTRKYGGTGIGLYIAKLIVEAHRGQIWIESEAGAGTTVHLLLPVKQNR